MASPANSLNQASGPGMKKSEAIDAMLQRLGIEEGEIVDLVFEEEKAAPKEGIKWMALAKVHTENVFSPLTFEQHMRNAWSLAKEIEFQHLDGNLFTVQCFWLGDWLKVIEGGPWLFRQNAVCIEKYDGLSSFDDVDLNYFATWIQIHKLPVGYRNEALIKKLIEKKVGKVLKVETDVNGAENFVQVRVKLDVRNVLARFVTISRAGNREFYQVKHEKIPKFCGACGFFGHSHLECGSEEHDEENLKWGDFLKADQETWQGRNFGFGREGGRGASRGGRGEPPGAGRGRDPSGRGRGMSTSWRHNAIVPSTEKSDPELDDTATSPSKNHDMDLDKRNPIVPAVKCGLDMDGVQADDGDLVKEGNEGNLVDNMVTDAHSPNDKIDAYEWLKLHRHHFV